MAEQSEVCVLPAIADKPPAVAEVDADNRLWADLAAGPDDRDGAVEQKIPASPPTTRRSGPIVPVRTVKAAEPPAEPKPAESKPARKRRSGRGRNATKAADHTAAPATADATSPSENGAVARPRRTLKPRAMPAGNFVNNWRSQDKSRVYTAGELLALVRDLVEEVDHDPLVTAWAFGITDDVNNVPVTDAIARLTVHRPVPLVHYSGAEAAVTMEAALIDRYQHYRKCCNVEMGTAVDCNSRSKWTVYLASSLRKEVNVPTMDEKAGVNKRLARFVKS